MKLVIREYLSMLKESGELDVFLPDLLLSMGIQPISRAQTGVRQYGVDIAAVGVDPDDKDSIETLFLLTVKKGDFSRANWDSGKIQDLRPSLNEIKDVYRTRCIDEIHKHLPKKIIVCCNGDMKQDVEANWLGYKQDNTKAGEIEFDFWGADKLALLIEEYLLDEYLFPEQSRKHLRKTIALVEQNEDGPSYFYDLIEESLFGINTSSSNADKSRNKALATLNLSLNIVFRWCEEADNLRPALLCAERTILRVWEWMKTNSLFEKKSVFQKFYQIFTTYLSIIASYANKLQPHCFIKDGLFGYSDAEEIEYPLRTFEAIGILGSYGIAIWNLISITTDEETKKEYEEHISAIAQMLDALIINNPSAYTPRYDSHAIDIVLGLITLTIGGYSERAKYWVVKLSSCIERAYAINRCFPIDSDSYDILIALSVGEAPSKQELTKGSILLPMLADWFVILDLPDDYQEFQKHINKTFAHTNFQFWFPDEGTEEFLYSTNAGYKSGVGRSVKIYESLEEAKQQIIKLRTENLENFKQITCIKNGWFSLAAIASRHFRTPVIPLLWHQLVSE